MTATSARNAWAVGWQSTGGALQTLIEHWNGSTWKQVPSPDPGGPASDNTLAGVAAVSSGNAWAAGSYQDSTTRDQTLIEHWDGSAWTTVPSPDPGGPYSSDELSGVAANSLGDIVAVGDAYGPSYGGALALYCT